MYDLILIGVTVLFVGYVLKEFIHGRGITHFTIDLLREYLNVKNVKKEIQFIDGRQPMKYAEFHIPGFRNIPIKAIKKEAKNLNKEQKVVLIDRTGMKGNEAAKRLKRRGFKYIENVQGGLSTW